MNSINRDYMDLSGRLAGNAAGVDAVEERAVSVAMTQLASSIGDLETVARALAGRVSPLIPGGSPFERAEKMATQTVGDNPAPKAIRSHHCDQIHARVYSICEITARLKEMVRGIEI